MNIILTGFMGTGKTTVGRIIAARLGMEFVDMDAVIEAREGESIVRLFQVKGEQYFRDLESALIREMASMDNCVVATGGGALMRRENLAGLKRMGVTVCLTAEPSLVLLRTSNTSDRPLLLKSLDAIRTIRHLMKEREPQYRKTDYMIDTSDMTPEQVADRIVEIAGHEDDTH